MSRRFNTTHYPPELAVPRQSAEELSITSLSVALVKNHKNRSVCLPTPCDVCQKMINEYPYISKLRHSGRRQYHVECALRVGLISRVPILNREGILTARAES